jgi:RNA polymerase sigma-70 factor (ECF subfamily)
LLGRASQESVQVALEKLPVIFREVLLLCDVEEMSYQEISETISVPIGTVMSRLYRARRAMREQLQKNSQGAANA